MFKEIPNSNTSVNKINVNKKWTFSTLSGNSANYDGSPFPVLDGLNITGSFYPSQSAYYTQTKEPLNWNGSYKRLVYDRENFLYYKYKKNPLTTFGVSEYDKEVRNIHDRITSVNIPYFFRGDRILPSSVKITDYSAGGGAVQIVDDGNSNLVLSGSYVTDKTELSSVNDTSNISYVGGATYKDSNNNIISKQQAIELYKSGSDVYIDTSSAIYVETDPQKSFYDPQKERFGYAIASYGEYLLASSVMEKPPISTSCNDSGQEITGGGPIYVSLATASFSVNGDVYTVHYSFSGTQDSSNFSAVDVNTSSIFYTDGVGVNIVGSSSFTMVEGSTYTLRLRHFPTGVVGGASETQTISYTYTSGSYCSDGLTTESGSKNGICSLFKQRGSGMSPIKVFRSPFQRSILANTYSYEGNFIQTEFGDFILYENEGDLISSGKGWSELNDNFGYALDINGENCAISSINAKNCVFNTSSYGLIFCYQKNKGGDDNWGIINVLEGEGPTDDFGNSISISENYMAVGAPGYSSGSGAVYVFKLKTYCGTDSEDGTPTASFESIRLLSDATGSILIGTGSSGSFSLAASPLIRNFWQPLYNKSLCLSKSIAGDGTIVYNVGSGSMWNGWLDRGREVFTEYSTVPTFVSGSNTWMLDTIITGPSGSRFGADVKISPTSMVIGHDLIKPSSSAWFYVNSQSLSGSRTIDNWSIFSTLNREDADSIENYSLGLNIKGVNSGFGNSVSMNGEYVCVGCPYDRLIGSGNSEYIIGSATIYKYSTEKDSCGTQSLDIRPIQKIYPSDFYKSYIAYGFSCDMKYNKLIIGAPKKNPFSKVYLDFNSSGSITVINPTSSVYDSYLGEAYVYSLDKQSNQFDLIEVVAKKSESITPDKVYGFSVAIERDKFFVGSPVFSAYNTSSVYYNQTSASSNLFLTNSSSWSNISGQRMSGSVYQYNYNLVDQTYIGNVFYTTGTLIITNTSSLYSNLLKGSGSSGFSVEYIGQHSIYEHEYIVSINPNEFNVSTNPSSLVDSKIPYDVNQDGFFDFNDLNILLKYLNGDEIEKSSELEHSYLKLEQNGSWWADGLLLTEAGDAIIAKTLVSNASEDKSRLTKERYDYIKDNLVSTGLLNIDLNFSQSEPLPTGIIDEREAKILWRYWLGKLTPEYISENVDDSSSRIYMEEIINFLNIMTGRVRPYPSKKQIGASNLAYSVNNGGIINPHFKDYIQSSSLDLSGSYLSTYITSVGLYSGGDLVVVGKLGTPIKNILTHPINISIKFDAF
jgi:hypothetical protein